MKSEQDLMTFTHIGVTGGLFVVSEAIIARPRGRALFCPFSRGLARGCVCVCVCVCVDSDIVETLFL